MILKSYIVLFTLINSYDIITLVTFDIVVSLQRFVMAKIYHFGFYIMKKNKKREDGNLRKEKPLYVTSIERLSNSNSNSNSKNKKQKTQNQID